MSLYTWGWGSDGQLGLEDREEEDRPLMVASLGPEAGHVTVIAAGHKHSACITVRGHLYTWGRGNSGQLGHGDKRERTQPQRVEGIGEVSVVAAGQYHTLAATTDGKLWSWGQGSSGQLGHGLEVPRKLEFEDPSLVSV